MIISIDVGKALGKIQHLLVIKISQPDEKPSTKHLPHRMVAFPLPSGIRQGCPISVQHCTRILARAVRQEKRNKRHKNQKRSKTIFSDDMIL
jgi:hypothetical protein